MNRDAEMLRYLSYGFRTCVTSAVGQGMGILLLSTLLGRRRSAGPVILYVWCRFLVLLIFMEFRIWHQNAEVLVLLNGTLGLCSTLGAIFVSKYTFHGDFLKIASAIVISEIILEMIIVPSIILVNLLEGRRDLLALGGKFQWMDLLAIPIEGILYGGVYAGLFPLLRKFRTYEIRHRKVMSAIAAGYVLLSQLLGLSDYISDSTSDLLLFVFIYLVMSFLEVALLASAYWIVQRYQKEIRQQRMFLAQQQHRMELYYQGIRDQMRSMEQNRKENHERMKDILAYGTEGSKKNRTDLEIDTTGEQRSGRQERLEAYLNELKAEYRKIQAGMYCNDWLVDAVLCWQKENAECRGIHMEYSMQGYGRGIIKEEELAQMLFYLLDFGILENERQETGNIRRICLRAGVVKNQLVLDFYTACQKSMWFPQKMFQEFVERWRGTVTEIREAQGIRVIVTLQRRGERREYDYRNLR